LNSGNSITFVGKPTDGSSFEILSVFKCAEKCANLKETLPANLVEYRGYQTIARNGKPCVPWDKIGDSDYHNKNSGDFPNGGLGTHTKCRNPDG
jgi:hypothetical protein